MNFESTWIFIDVLHVLNSVLLASSVRLFDFYVFIYKGIKWLGLDCWESLNVHLRNGN